MSAVKGRIKKRFDEIGTIFSGSTPSTSIRSFWDGEIVWVTPNDLSKLNTPYLNDSANRITEKGLKGCSAHLLPAGSLVMSSRAPIGYLALPTVQFCTNQGCKTIKLKSVFHPEFTYYNVLFNIHKIRNLGEGTTFAEISKTALSTIELSFPTSLPEQTKIAEILSTVDRAIEQTEALIAKQQRIKTGLMQDLLTRGIDEHGTLRSEQTHKFKDSPLGRIPVEWEVKKVIEVSTKVTDGDHDTPQRTVEGFYLLSARNVNEGYIGLSDVDYVPASEYERMLRRCNPEAGDILVSCSGTIGRVCEVPEWLKCVLVRSAALIKFNREAIISRFAEWTMRSFVVQLEILAAQRQAAQPNLFQGEIKNLRVPQPQIEEQQRIAQVLDSLQTNINRCQMTLRKLSSLKTALMQDLLTGKRRVTPMLEKIL
jgi:type I restriction enzyme S subunit